jgi:hypothetical protein
MKRVAAALSRSAGIGGVASNGGGGWFDAADGIGCVGRRIGDGISKLGGFTTQRVGQPSS